ncbi:MAG: DUF5020 family protein [Bacteroidales bacterium]|nr:DUF5020 family protein [Bacteroidales bacterium]
MLRKAILAVAFATLVLAQGVKAQTNLQVFYDFGPDRQHVTTTVEGFYADNWGNTFFFIDHDYNSKADDGHVFAPSGTYWEIARCLNFWQDSQLAPFSVHVEYNGGVYNGFTVNNAFLGGVDYFMHTEDFLNTLNLKVLGKYIDYAGARDMNGNLRKSLIPIQLTAVWGMQDLFNVKGLRFSGFADFWWENHTVYRSFFTHAEEEAWYRAHEGQQIDEKEFVKDSEIVFISEPQLWYNVGQHFGVPNLNVGGEVELSIDFGGVMGFRARPCLGLKWVF